MPNGTLYLTHSTLFTLHDRLVGRSIQTEYETVPQISTTASGTTINTRTSSAPATESPPAAFVSAQARGLALGYLDPQKMSPDRLKCRIRKCGR